MTKRASLAIAASDSRRCDRHTLAGTRSVSRPQDEAYKLIMARAVPKYQFSFSTTRVPATRHRGNIGIPSALTSPSMIAFRPFTYTFRKLPLGSRLPRSSDGSGNDAGRRRGAGPPPVVKPCVPAPAGTAPPRR